MRIIDGYNIAALLLSAGITLYALLRNPDRRNTVSQSTVSLDYTTDKQRMDMLALLFLAAGIFLRLWKLGAVPQGMQQDEASIGYEAYSLLHYSIDRNGFSFPVYPITWGSGGGSPLMIYMSMPFFALFGCHVWSLRLLPALLGIFTLIFFYFLLKKTPYSKAAALGLGFLALNPWHVMLSRWALDCNILPFWFCLAALLFILGEDFRKTYLYCLSAGCFAVCLYAYGSATVTIPLTLLLLSIYGLYRKTLTLRQLLLSVLTFLLVFLPLGLFYAVNFLDLPSAGFLFLTIQKLTAKRSVFYPFDHTLPGNILHNLLYFARALTVGTCEGEQICNAIPGYVTMYRFTFPVTLLGLILAIRNTAAGLRRREKNNTAPPCPDAVFLFTFASTLLFSLFIEPALSRLTMLFIPLIYFHVCGLHFLFQRRKQFAAVCMSLVLGAFLLFCRDYFGNTYADRWAEAYMPGYGEAMVYADSILPEGRTVYSTYENVAAPFMLTLFYTRTPAPDFVRTAVYRSDEEEFRIATSFGHFVFGLPEDIHAPGYRQDILVISREEAGLFPAPQYSLIPFGGYFVVTSGSQ